VLVLRAIVARMPRGDLPRSREPVRGAEKDFPYSCRPLTPAPKLNSRA
jgi:hypothetical protein